MEPKKRLVVGLAAVALLMAIIGLQRVASTPSMSMLYSGLNAATSGEVISSLEQRGVAFDVRGTSIYVPDGQRDELRMALAGEGLPANGSVGYEILDDLSGFGTTSEMFDAAYWRAKEGELARTILASPNVRLARVHIANPSRRPFERNVTASASVIVSLGAGALGVPQAQAIRYLVASAVAGLSPDAVSVVDADNGVVLRAGDTGAGATSAAAPGDRAVAMRGNIERLLEARVGAGKAIVEIMIDADMDRETITERVLDPESRVAIHTDSSTTSQSDKGTAAGGVTVASNLPDGETSGGGESSSTRSESRELFNYEFSEVRRERVRNPGQIRRISAAVLVDGVTSIAPNGDRSWAPRSEEELAALGELVRSAIGFDETRGDVVTIETLEFSATGATGVAAESSPLDFLSANAMSLIQLTVLGLVVLALGLFVLRPIMTTAPPPLIAPPREPENAAIEGIAEAQEAVLIGSANDDGVQSSLNRLREAVNDRSEESQLLLRNWLESGDAGEEKA